MDLYFLTTRRLGFRCWREDDYNIALGLWGDRRVTKFIDSRGKLSGELVKERLLLEISNQKKYKIQYWPIFLLKSDENVGCCGLRPYDEFGGIFEIGFHIRSDHWREGYATEAAKGVIKYAFETLSISGLFAGHHPQNRVSGHLLEGLGFERRSDEWYAATGLYHPSYFLTSEVYFEKLRQRGSGYSQD